ncbi:MAG: crotonase/enoyl-CoA hydratase family protein [Alphaproteobacteria bacterium]|nr:MAG: crotonase/enoyl-CoA hydratase family protein [Alphaproteobacteria bacterium]
MDQKYEMLAVTIADGIAHVELDNPTRANALSAAFWDDLPRLADALDADSRVRAVVISGRGRHFTAGIDLNMFAAFAPDPAADPARVREKLFRRIRAMQETFSSLERCRKPWIAAVHGACLGAGVDLVTACDLRFAARDAEFAIQEINIGMVADVGTLQRAPRLLPEGIVRELAYTGRRMAAEEAARYGFVNGLADDREGAMAAAMEAARTIAAKSPLAIAGTKEVLNHARDHTIEDGLRHVAAWNAGMLIGSDLMKGAAAALSKQTPDYDDLME